MRSSFMCRAVIKEEVKNKEVVVLDRFFVSIFAWTPTALEGGERAGEMGVADWTLAARCARTSISPRTPKEPLEIEPTA